MSENFQCVTLAFIFHMLHHKFCETSSADDQITLYLPLIKLSKYAIFIYLVLSVLTYSIVLIHKWRNTNRAVLGLSQNLSVQECLGLILYMSKLCFSGRGESCLLTSFYFYIFIFINFIIFTCTTWLNLFLI